MYFDVFIVENVKPSGRRLRGRCKASTHWMSIVDHVAVAGWSYGEVECAPP
jgi:hypothetical protein